MTFVIWGEYKDEDDRTFRAVVRESSIPPVVLTIAGYGPDTVVPTDCVRRLCERAADATNVHRDFTLPRSGSYYYEDKALSPQFYWTDDDGCPVLTEEITDGEIAFEPGATIAVVWYYYR